MKPFDPIEAAKQYTKLDHAIQHGAYDERESDGSYGADGIEEAYEDLEVRAANHGLKFVRNESTTQYELQPMTDDEKAEHRSHIELAVVECLGAQASLWSQTKKTTDITDYYITIVDDKREMTIIATVNFNKREIAANVYNPPDFNYADHDFCDHAGDYCVFDDPSTSEYIEAQLANARANAIKTLSDKYQEIKQHIMEQRLKPY